MVKYNARNTTYARRRVGSQTRPNNRGRLILLVIIVGLSLFLAACSPSTTPTPIVIESLAQPKQLATVYMSPTPDEAQRQATRLAFQPSSTPPPTSGVPTATVYIGVFLGEAASLDNVAMMATSAVGTEVERTPLPRFANCPMPPDDRLQGSWRDDSAATRDLGCPAAEAIPYDGVTQIFERGVMYTNPDGAIWALALRPDEPSQYWRIEGATPYQSIDVVPPPNLQVPAVAFGALWMGVPGVRDALGFAQTEAADANFVVQLFQGGSLLHDTEAGQTFVLVGPDDMGTVYGPY